MSPPLVTRIVIIYNQWHFLHWLDNDALFTPGTEFILIDDCSPTPPPTELLARLAALNITYHRLPRNSGRCVARNEGARLARSEWIEFIDGDDLPFPLSIDPAWGTVDLVFFPVERHGPDLPSAPTVFVHPATANPLSPTGYDDPRPAAMLWRRTAFLSLLGFDARYERAEDMEITLRARHLTRFYETKPKQSYYAHVTPRLGTVHYSVPRLEIYQRHVATQKGRESVSYDLVNKELRGLWLVITWELLSRRQLAFLFRSSLALLKNLGKARAFPRSLGWPNKPPAPGASPP